MALRTSISLVFLAALAMVSTAGAADWVNRVGIYTDEVASAVRSDVAGTPVTLYAILHNPMNGSTPLVNVNGFEFRLILDGVSVTDVQLPAGSVNAGTGPNNFVVGSSVNFNYSAASDGMVQLMSMDVLCPVAQPSYIYFAPANRQSIAGEMSFIDTDAGELVVMTPACTSNEMTDPVFGFFYDPVATEDESWGSVKALFR